MNRLLTLIFSIVAVSAMAQETESRKPAAKAFTAEVNFAPFSSSPVNISYIRLRRFVTENTAFRIGFSLGLKNDKPTEDLTRSTFELNLRPGYEWHLPGTDKISPYYGIELDIAMKSSSEESDEDGDEYTIDGSWDNGAERGFTRIGANFILGVDVYVIKRLYLGTEIGFGFENVSTTKVKVKNGDGDTIGEDKGGSLMQIGPNFNSAIRLGFVF